MGRWKLLDNLRRSLAAPAALLALLVAWLQPTPVAAIWTAFILLTISLPPLLPAIAGIVPRRAGVTWRNHLRTLRGDFALGLLQSAFLVTFLAHQSWLMIDAVGRTLFRLFVRRRHLLQWTTAAQAKDDDSSDRRGLALQIAASVVSAGVVAIVLYSVGQRSWLIAAPFVGVWVLSPLVARWASLPPPAAGHLLVAADDALALRLVARRTWRFFETFVTPEDNMLPPDNFQEDPKPVTAHRTSPTNLGLYLLSIIAARDFGWLGTFDTLERLETTFASMAKLEQFRGHFYNWYDTRDLSVLEPKYISSVDSGNLAGHLIVVGNACREIAAGPIGNHNWISGLQDTLALVREAAAPPQADARRPGGAHARLNEAADVLAAALRSPTVAPTAIARRLSDLAPMADALVACAHAYSLECGDPAGDRSASVRTKHGADVGYLGKRFADINHQ